MDLIYPTEKAKKFAEQLNYRHNGLITVIAQDWKTKDVLMVAHANKEAVEKTLTTGLVHYWSTERKKLWMKGETSKHIQHLKAVYVDCDADALLVKIKQEGAACHLGYRSCFFRQLKNEKLETVEKKAP